MENGESRGAKDTARTEAFSDGVFAFAITLLVLNLRDPATSGVSLSQGLIDELPAFFALGTSFITILVMWLNHHNMFSHIGRVDRRLMLRNGMLLLFVVLTPFTTSLVAGHLALPGPPDAPAPPDVFSVNLLFFPVAEYAGWRDFPDDRLALHADVTDREVSTLIRLLV